MKVVNMNGNISKYFVIVFFISLASALVLSNGKKDNSKYLFLNIKFEGNLQVKIRFKHNTSLNVDFCCCK